MLWNHPAQITALTSSSKPGAVAFGAKLHVVAPEQGDNKLVHSILHGDTWTSTTLTQKTSKPVALAVFQERLVCAYVDSSSKIQLMTWDAQTNTWSATLSTTFSVATGLALASHQGLLYLVTRFSSSSILQYCTWNGVDGAWSAAEKVNTKISPTTNHTPALVSHAGRLFLLFSVNDSTEVQVYEHAGKLLMSEAFVLVSSVTGAKKNAKALAATSYNGQLWLFMCNSSGVNLGYTWSGGRWDPVSLPGFAKSVGGFAAAVHEGALALLTANDTDKKYPLMFAEGVVGGVRPRAAQPLWSHSGRAYATTSLPPSYFGGARPFTLMAWVNPANTAGTQYILSDLLLSGDEPSSGHIALALRDGRPALYFAGRWLDAQGGPVSIDDWTHVAATFDGRSVTLYIDGVNSGYTQFTLDDLTRPTPSTLPALIGATATPSGVTGHFSGTIQRVSVFNSARSELQMMQSGFVRLNPQESLIADYTFGHASPYDRSGRGGTLTTAGSPTYLIQTTALSLDGASGLDCTSSDAEASENLSFGAAEDMTVTAWVYGDADPSAVGTILYRAGQYALTVNSDGRVTARAGGGATYTTGAGLVKTRTWCHVAFTYGGGALTIWVNGEPQNITQTPTTADEAVDHTTLGCRPSGAAGYRGHLASVTVWRQAMTARQLNASRAKSPIAWPGLAANYDLCSGAIDDTTGQSPRPTAIGAGLTLALVNETVDAGTCGATDSVEVLGSSPFDDEEVEITALTLPEGQTVAGSRTLTSEQAVWLIKLVLTIVLGFAGILGLSAGSKLTGSLQSYLTKNTGRVVTGLNRLFTSIRSRWKTYGDDAVAVLIALVTNAPGLALDTLIALIANVILDMLRGLYDEGVLKNMFEVIGDNLSWWDFLNLLANLAAFLLPWATAAKVASLIIQLAVLGEQLIRLALDFPHTRGIMAEAAPIDSPPPGAKRAALLQGQLSPAFA